jgi:UrcA family protein
MRVHAAMLVATGTLGLAFAFLPAKAQDVNAGGANEVVVVAPHIRAETSPLNAPPEGIWISEPVSYADLDLRTSQGAHELRLRVRAEAARICDRLREIYPHALPQSESCFRNTLTDAMPKADAAITDVRIAARRGEYYGGYENGGVW